METFSPAPEETKGKEIKKEEIAARVKNRLSELLHNYHSEQVDPLSMEEKHQRAKTGTDEDRERLEKYKHSKFRVNWLSSLLGDLRLALDEKILDVPDREELIREEKQLFRALNNFQKQNPPGAFGNKVPADLVERGENLLKKVLNEEEK